MSLSGKKRIARVVLRSGSTNKHDFTSWVDLKGVGFDHNKPLYVRVEAVSPVTLSGGGVASKFSGLHVLCSIPQGPSFDSGCAGIGSVAANSQSTMLTILPMYNLDNTNSRFTFLNCCLPVRPIMVRPHVFQGQNIRIWFETSSGTPLTNAGWNFSTDRSYVVLAVYQ